MEIVSKLLELNIFPHLDMSPNFPGEVSNVGVSKNRAFSPKSSICS